MRGLVDPEDQSQLLDRRGILAVLSTFTNCLAQVCPSPDLPDACHVGFNVGCRAVTPNV